MLILIFILFFTILNSFISFIGVVFLSLNEKALHKILIILVAFASGALLGGSFFHLIPESYGKIGDASLTYILLSILLFFVIEKFLRWRHCHKVECDTHAFAYLNLIGDGVHNFIDGIIIAASFLSSIELGIVSAIAVIMHEIPQEIGDFGVLVYGGFSKMKALSYNFLSQISSIFGAIFTYYLISYVNIDSFLPYLISLAAGGFIYIGATDLFPELHKREVVKDSIIQLIAIILGIVVIWSLRFIFE